MMVVVSFSIGFRNTFNPTPVSLDVGQFRFEVSRFQQYRRADGHSFPTSTGPRQGLESWPLKKVVSI